jgi:DNA polymerase-3 subunit beta
MNIHVQKNDLIHALQIITPITDKSTTKPILSNFLLSAGEGKTESVTAEFAATDYELAIKGRIPIEMEEAGTVCISAKKVLEVCREFLAEKIAIRTSEQMWVTIEGGSSRLRLPSMDVGLYPQMDMADLGSRFQIRTDALKQAIDLTIFATLANEARKNLMGVNLKMAGEGVSRWTSTDGHRLAQVNKPIEDGQLSGAPEIIIPRKALGEMRKVLDTAGETVTLSYDERSLKLDAGPILLTTRLIEGKFPNVDPIIPKDNDKRVDVKREKMLNSLKIVSLMSTEKIKPVKLSLAVGTMRLESERAEYGDAVDEIAVEYQGEPFQIGFNANYLMDVLTKAEHGEVVRMEMKGPLNPCLMHLPNDPSFLSVVMPLRIEW